MPVSHPAHQIKMTNDCVMDVTARALEQLSEMSELI